MEEDILDAPESAVLHLLMDESFEFRLVDFNVHGGRPPAESLDGSRQLRSFLTRDRHGGRSAPVWSVATITVTGEQRKVVDEGIRLGLVRNEREAAETGLAKLRERVNEEVTVARFKQKAEEEAERERIVANQFSLFGDSSSDSD